jgi:hypothetical protein
MAEADELADLVRSLERSATGYWAALIGDPLVAVHGDADGGFLYRPGQLLVDESPERRSADDRAAVEEHIARHGGTRRSTARTVEAVTDADGAEQRDPLQELGIARFDLPLSVDVPTLARGLRVRYDNAELRERSGVELDVDAPGFTWPAAVAAMRDGRVTTPVASPNHVLPSAQHWKFGPCGLPEVAPPPSDPPPSMLEVGHGVVIAVLDSGWAPNPSPLLTGHRAGAGHLDLDVVQRSGEIRSANGGHGTFVAGVIRQAAPGSTIHAIRTLDRGLTDDAELAADLLLARDTIPGLRIVNLSLGGPTLEGWPCTALSKALLALQADDPADDVLVVAAAGNDGSAIPFYPAAFWGADPELFRNVVGVGALGTGTRGAPFSNHGPWVRASAPGVGLVSTYASGRLLTPTGPRDFAGGARWSGTSFATPSVVGRIAAGMTAAGGSASEILDRLELAGTGIAGLGVGIL